MERLKTIDELRIALKDLRSFGDSLKTNFAEFEKFIVQDKFDFAHRLSLFLNECRMTAYISLLI